MDVAAGKSKITAFPNSAFKSPPLGPAPAANVQTVAKMIDEAKLPVLFLGQRAASTIVVGAIRQFLTRHPIAVVETFQAAGAVSADLADDVYFGRVGLFRNQTGDRVLARSDLILCLGYDPTECKCWSSLASATDAIPSISIRIQSTYRTGTNADGGSKICRRRELVESQVQLTCYTCGELAIRSQALIAGELTSHRTTLPATMARTITLKWSYSAL